MKKRIIAMLLAGGQGSRLGSMTHQIAKPAVAFGGKYRIIDFSLSNCANSRIDTVGVLTQYKPLFLNSYIGTGAIWDLDEAGAGTHILPPYVGEKGGNWYNGTAGAIYQNIDFINMFDPEYVLIISGDHIYMMDYSLMLDFHCRKQAEVTIASIEVPWSEASRFGIVSTDDDDRIDAFAEKPSQPNSNLASMGIYIFNWQLLKQALVEDEHNNNSEHDFGKNIIPMLLAKRHKLYAYRFSGYWKDVGTIDSYYEANMDLLKPEPEFDIFERNYLRVLSNSDVLPPQYIGPEAKVNNCLIGNGCIVKGNISNSVISTGVFIDQDADIEDCILLPNARILSGCRIKKTIVRENAVLSSDLCSDSGADDLTESAEDRTPAGVLMLPKTEYLPPTVLR